MSIIPQDTRHCPRCKREKPLNDFSPRGTYCRPCTTDYARDRAFLKAKYVQPTLPFLKICAACHTEKYLEEFAKDPSKKFGHKVYCLQCSNDRIKRYKHSPKGREQQNEHKRRKYATDPQYVEMMRAANQKWHRNNPEKHRQRAMRRKARKMAVPIEEVDYKRILDREGMTCHICNAPILPEHTLQFDHVIPLARGGGHTEDNIKPSHRQCNIRKKDLLMEELAPFHRRGV